MDIRFSDLVQLISGPRFDRDRDGELIVRDGGREITIPRDSLTTDERRVVMDWVYSASLIHTPEEIPIDEPTIALIEVDVPGFWLPENTVILHIERWVAVKYLQLGGVLARYPG